MRNEKRPRLRLPGAFQVGAPEGERQPKLVTLRPRHETPLCCHRALPVDPALLSLASGCGAW